MGASKSGSICCTTSNPTPDRLSVPQNIMIYKMKPNLKPDIQQEVLPDNPQLYKENHKIVPGVKVAVKVPLQMGIKSRFKWIMQNKWTYPISIKDKDPKQIMRRSFQQKCQWFRLKVQQRKKSWMQGSQIIYVDRQNILQSSLSQLDKLDVTKQLKISFNDQKGQNDAGGIFRQWLYLCIKQICQKDIGLLQLCQTQDTFYKFTPNQALIIQCLKTAQLLGYLIAKALMQRVPLACHLNHTIWRQILQQRITIDDMYTYDQAFHKSWKSILGMNQLVSELYLNFTAEVKDPVTKKTKGFKLVKDGQNVPVTQQNKQEYIQKLIQFYCVNRIEKAVTSIKKKLFQIIPFEYLMVFQPHQIDCLLCGQQNIDVDDWKANTVYEVYTQSDVTIEWFWKIMYSLQKNMLKNMLHYCTGCSRVPVTGFKYLQSNRGQIKRFTVKKVPYDKQNPYPKSYTCFNRLQLPCYESFEQMQTRIYNICTYEITEINLEA